MEIRHKKNLIKIPSIISKQVTFEVGGMEKPVRILCQKNEPYLTVNSHRL